MTIHCGHCTDTHATVDDVIVCAFQHGTFTRKKAAWMLQERREARVVLPLRPEEGNNSGSV